MLAQQRRCLSGRGSTSSSSSSSISSSVRPAAAAPALARVQQQQHQRRRRAPAPARAIELDFSDPDTQLSVAGVVLGLVMGLGAPAFYISRTERDEERLDELRAINRATYQETGEYMSDDEIAKIRKPKWTDRREFVDDD